MVDEDDEVLPFSRTLANVTRLSSTLGSRCLLMLFLQSPISNQQRNWAKKSILYSTRKLTYRAVVIWHNLEIDVVRKILASRFLSTTTGPLWGPQGSHHGISKIKGSKSNSHKFKEVSRFEIQASYHRLEPLFKDISRLISDFAPQVPKKNMQNKNSKHNHASANRYDRSQAYETHPKFWRTLWRHLALMKNHNPRIKMDTNSSPFWSWLLSSKRPIISWGKLRCQHFVRSFVGPSCIEIRLGQANDECNQSITTNTWVGKTLYFHCTDCLLGILIMVYCNPHITG